MKNSKQGNSRSHKEFSLKESILKYRERHTDDIRRIVVLILIGMISTLIIQERVDVQHFVGSFLISAIILYIFYKDIRRYKPGYLREYKMLFLLGLLVAVTLLISKISAYMLNSLQKGFELPAGDAFIYGIPIAAGAMFVKLIFDFHTAIIFSFAISLLSGIWFDNSLFVVYVFISCLTATFSVMRCRRRSDIIKGGVYVSVVNTAVAGVILLSKGDILSYNALSAFLFAALSGLNVAAVVSILLPAIESAFGVTTDISLLELLDLDQPLMHNLMIAAPGTYHHSVIVGNLAEAAAEAVGANPLLARVTAYYHDIGKLKMPEYFVENQGLVGKHDRLTPHMSSMILISHVKEGLDLARQHKLPKIIIDIIQQHHGTNLITFFYSKALEQHPCEAVSQEEYRYPGPKPQTRVAAIVMMADAVEAASRSLSDPTAMRISSLVDKIINNIFIDGQFDECELTLRDISEIKRRFARMLISIFHRRIEYPEVERKGIALKTEGLTGIYAEDRGENQKRDNGNRDSKQTETDQGKSQKDKKDFRKDTWSSDR
ncbi:MAG: HDIG domain-containing protein [Nitrospirae bacterium]|nr:HDIG domain-containing protein [Nitrospirota bacterium]